ncbi:MAG: bifunctional 23S rRNA (guanine(2069)-N(7))-methyltransferase RlmK/23S rRNA (guanine(2445)-N(2))-methyltransferase RlmL [Pseudomonadota bacterium]
MTEKLNFFATAPKGIPSLLTQELKAIGAQDVKEALAGVSFKGSLETAYRVCLWSRLANRVLLSVAKFPAGDADKLYDGVSSMEWADHLDPDGSIAVDFTSSQSEIRHTHYGALRVKDGIVDHFRRTTGSRPSVELKRPDVRINVHLLRDEATVYVDLSGESLHMRGYRQAGVNAPLKENLAAALLIRAGWPDISKAGGGLMDPMCGSGTLPIEAALMAADCAPGLLRQHFGFLKWKGHSEKIWEALVDEAEDREKAGFEKMPPIVGYDSDSGAIKSALMNLERAGLKGQVHFEKRELADFEPHPRMKSSEGLVIVNPPYGERLGDLKEVSHLYSNLGQRLKSCFGGWKASVLIGNIDLGKSIGIRSSKKYTFYNGALECSLLNFHMKPENVFRDDQRPVLHHSGLLLNPKTRPEVEMFANRIGKNLAKLKKWLQREDIHCYRLYDRDLPEYAVAVDVYETFVHVQEYEAPSSIDPEKAKRRLNDVLVTLPGILQVPGDHVFLKVRRRQRGGRQYGRLGSDQVFHEVREGGLKFLINLGDYLDTGLFLDQRLTRRLIGDLAGGKRFLNLFAYTGTATVYAARGGAKSTMTVDFSENYLDWARKNLALNGYAQHRHTFVKADCMAWMTEERQKYDLIFLDPPTHSNSKKLKRDFELQRDHADLIRQGTHLLEKGGVLIFSNNFRDFKIDHGAMKDLRMKDMTEATLPPDFERNSKMHHCWEITRAE